MQCTEDEIVGGPDLTDRWGSVASWVEGCSIEDLLNGSRWSFKGAFIGDVAVVAVRRGAASPSELALVLGLLNLFKDL